MAVNGVGILHEQHR